MPISRDDFWDGKRGGGVRCSSEGDAATQYHDPTTQTMEGSYGRSVASLLPTGARGLRGVIVPRSTPGGGSLGFDPHRPTLINIDPDIKGQSCVVDLSKLTRESMQAAYKEALDNPLVNNDLGLAASYAFSKVAVGNEPVGMGQSPGPVFQDRAAPFGGIGTYVVPKASLGGGQITDNQGFQPLDGRNMPNPMSPSVAPRKKLMPNKETFKSVEPELLPLDEAPAVMKSSSFQDQTPAPIKADKRVRPVVSVQPTKLSARPSTKVTFETEGWGTFEAVYHGIIKNGTLLVLVYETDFKEGLKYFPPSCDKLIAARIEGTNRIYYVHSTGSRFEHAGHEYCLLIIDSESEIPDDE